MSGFLRVRIFSHAAQSTTSVGALRRCFHSGSNNPNFCSSDRLSPSAAQGNPPKRVGVFWNLDCSKPSQSFPPFRIANSLKVAASSLGKVHYMVAYGSRHAIDQAQQAPKQSEDKEGIPKRVKPSICGVCRRKFYDKERLLSHFSQIHEREYLKRLSEIDSAKGKKRVNLVGRYSVKMDKYRYAVRDILSLKEGQNLEAGLERAGFWVRGVVNIPQAAVDALRTHMMDMMDQRRLQCLFLVSNNSELVDVLKEARLRCVHTVVVSTRRGGTLWRTADAAFSWKDIMSGKAKAKGEKVLRCWKDGGTLKRLEWTYDSETGDEKSGSVDQDGLGGGNTDIEDLFEMGEDDFERKIDKGAWWKLDTNAESSSVNSF